MRRLGLSFVCAVLLQQQKLKIVAGQADGRIQLVDYATEQARELRGVRPYPSGYYEIRAHYQRPRYG